MHHRLAKILAVKEATWTVLISISTNQWCSGRFVGGGKQNFCPPPKKIILCVFITIISSIGQVWLSKLSMDSLINCSPLKSGTIAETLNFFSIAMVREPDVLRFKEFF